MSEAGLWKGVVQDVVVDAVQGSSEEDMSVDRQRQGEKGHLNRALEVSRITLHIFDVCESN